MSAVDVVIPCYNYARYLETCVSSVLSQRDVDVRILIVDDCSSDNTPEECARLAALDSRVTYMRHAVNQGLVATANDGIIGWATAKYTLLISADDALVPGALARAAQVMDRHPEVGMVYGKAQVITDNSEMNVADDPTAYEYRIVTGAEFLAHSCEHWCGVASPTAVIRTEVQHLIGGLNPKMPHTCDMEIWMRLATRASIAALPTIQAYYRRHDSNMSIPYIDRPLSDFREQLFTATDVQEHWGQHMPEYDGWVAIMKKRMLVQVCWVAGLANERGDFAGERTCMEFAKELSPNLWQSKAWWRYQAKRLMGPVLTSKLRSIVRQEADAPTHGSHTTFRHSELFGWWPEIGVHGKIAANDAEERKPRLVVVQSGRA